MLIFKVIIALGTDQYCLEDEGVFTNKNRFLHQHTKNKVIRVMRGAPCFRSASLRVAT